MSKGKTVGGTQEEARRRRPHRLERQAYRCEVAAAFTACIAGRQEIFTSREIVDPFHQALLRACSRHQCKVLICCVMPDHVHAILQGRSPSADVWKAMTLIKQLTGFWLARHFPAIKWQGDFFDHVFRDEAEVPGHLRYIAENPVRRGLVEDWRDYPLTWLNGGDPTYVSDVPLGGSPRL